MEMLLLAMILAKVVQNGVVDIAFAVRGKPSPRWGSKRRWRADGSASRYFGQLWNDSWDDALTKHSERRARRQTPATSSKTRTPAGQFFAGLVQDAGRSVRRKADEAFVRADEKRRSRTIRSRPGQDTVPGEVVPNRDGGQDGRQDRPQDETGPDPRTGKDEDETTGQDEPDSSRQDEDEEPPPCPKCGTTMTTALNIGDPMSYDGKGIYRCPSCDYKIRRSPEPTDDTTQEGTIDMTATTTEVVGLSDTIRFCEDSAAAYRAQAQATERTQAAIEAGGVTGTASQMFASAMENCNAAASAMDEAAAEFKQHLGVQEQYNANPGAGTREFVTAGQ